MKKMEGVFAEVRLRRQFGSVVTTVDD